MLPSDHPSRALRFPVWQRAYEAVLSETDTEALFKLVEIAEATVLTRRAALDGKADHHSERQAIEQALQHLQFVKKSRLKFG